MGSQRVGHDWVTELNWYLNGLVVFPTLFNLSLNFAVRSSSPEPWSVPGLAFADCIELLHLWLQRIWSIWFRYWPSGDIHSMCRVNSCVVGRGCLLWPVRSFGKTLLAFALLHLFSKAKLVCYSRYLLVPCFCITVPYDEEGVFFFLILVLEGLVGLHRILFIWGSKRLQWSSMAVLTPEVKDLSVKICPSPFFLSKNIILTTTHSVIRKLS